MLVRPGRSVKNYLRPKQWHNVLEQSIRQVRRSDSGVTREAALPGSSKPATSG